jgi:hypothetical protein
LYICPTQKGRVAERLGKGLQNLVQRFESARDLAIERLPKRRPFFIPFCLVGKIVIFMLEDECVCLECFLAKFRRTNNAITYPSNNCVFKAFCWFTIVNNSNGNGDKLYPNRWLCCKLNFHYLRVKVVLNLIAFSINRALNDCQNFIPYNVKVILKPDSLGFLRLHANITPYFKN